MTCLCRLSDPAYSPAFARVIWRGGSGFISQVVLGFMHVGLRLSSVAFEEL